MNDCRPVLLAWMVACAACAPSTQITFDIRTDVPCADIQSVGITVGPTGTVEGKDPVVATTECTEAGNVRAIGTYSVVPQTSPVDVTVRVALAGKGVNLESDCTERAGYRGCIVGRRALTFIPKRSLVVPIDLLLVCRGVACDEFTTCNRLGRCVSARVDVSKCEGDTCSATVEGPDDALPAAVETFSALTIAPQTVAADGVSLAVVALTLRDSVGAPLANQPVTFGSNGSENLWSTTSSTTDDAGAFTAGLASVRAEGKTVIVSAAGLTLSGGVTFVASDGGATTQGPDGGSDAGRDAGFLGDAGTLPGIDGGFCRNANDCDDGNFCNGSEQCVAARCRAAGRAFCDDENPCSVDLCNEASRMCSYSATLVDADGDGHYPLACGANADDCDDGDPFTWGGPLPAPERCDFKDNNCNGNVDEGLWLEKAGSRVAVTSGSMYPNGVGAPALRRFDDFFYVAVASDSTDRGSMDVFKIDATNLGVVLGPVKAFGSTTSWTSNVNGTVIEYGKRVFRPQLEVSDAGVVMVTGVTRSWSHPSTCSGQPSVAVSAFALVSPDLVVLDAGETASSDLINAGCFGWRSDQNDVPTALWVPQTGRWALVTPVQAVSSSKLYLEVALVGLSGVLTTSRRLIEDGPLGPGAGVPNVTPPSRALPQMAVLPTGVFVGWLDPGYGSRYAVFSHDFNAVISGPFTLQAAVASDFKSVAFTGQEVKTNLYSQQSGSASNVLVSFDILGNRKAGAQILVAPASQFGGADFRSGAFTSVRFTGPESALFTAHTSSSGMAFGWGLNRPDAGLLNVNVPIGTPTTHSDFAIAPIDSKNVAIFWVDGDLKRTVMQCAP